MSPEEWSKHVETWQTSGESQSAYCRKQGLNINKFYTWKGKLKKQARSPKQFAVMNLKEKRANQTGLEVKIIAEGLTTITLQTPREFYRVTKAIEILTGT